MNFHPSFFERRATAQEILSKNGFVWMEGYSTIDLAHDLIGLEICGIPTEGEAKRILKVLRLAFPDWSYSSLFLQDFDPRDRGWQVNVHKLAEVTSAF